MTHAEARRSTRRHRSHWWLAGLLFGCLLPMGLAQARLDAFTERLVRICLQAPDTIRAASRQRLKRHAGVLKKPAFTYWHRQRRPALATSEHARVTAAEDVLSRRGPPVTMS